MNFGRDGFPVRQRREPGQVSDKEKITFQKFRLLKITLLTKRAVPQNTAKLPEYHPRGFTKARLVFPKSPRQWGGQQRSRAWACCLSWELGGGSHLLQIQLTNQLRREGEECTKIRS